GGESLHGGRGCARLADLPEDVVQVVQDILIGKVKDAESATGEDLIPGFVVPALVIVDAAVNLDHEMGGVAVEVDDEPVDDLLAAEAFPVQPAASYRIPQVGLGCGHLLSEFTGAFHLLA